MKKMGLRRFRSTFGNTFEQLECKRLLAADVMIGDSDGNGMFGSEDLVQVFQAGKFESGRSASFAEGDWNNDGVFNTSDIVHAMQRGRFGQRILQPDGATPEAERPDGVAGRPQGGRPDNAESGDRAARVQATVDRIQTAIKSGNLPEGVTAEQAAQRLAALQNALATGERPEGQRPEGFGRPDGVGGRPNVGRPQGGRPDDAESGDRTARVQATVDRIQTAIESGNLPESVTAEQAAERLAVLRNALATGERPDDHRPDGVGRPDVVGGSQNGRRSF